jgi:hypothetical protein
MLDTRRKPPGPSVWILTEALYHRTSIPNYRDNKSNFRKKQYCCAAFLDITKVFDKVWHTGLLFKIRIKNLPHAYYKILESYLRDRLFQVKFKDEITILRKTEAGVLQGSALGPIVLYLIYTSDLPTSDNATAATFSGTAILATHEDPAIASMELQVTISKDDWVKQWRNKINQRKSLQIRFVLHNHTFPIVQMGNADLPTPEK